MGDKHTRGTWVVKYPMILVWGIYTVYNAAAGSEDISHTNKGNISLIRFHIDRKVTSIPLENNTGVNHEGNKTIKTTMEKSTQVNEKRSEIYVVHNGLLLLHPRKVLSIAGTKKSKEDESSSPINYHVIKKSNITSNAQITNRETQIPMLQKSIVTDSSNAKENSSKSRREVVMETSFTGENIENGGVKYHSVARRDIMKPSDNEWFKRGISVEYKNSTADQESNYFKSVSQRTHRPIRMQHKASHLLPRTINKSTPPKSDASATNCNIGLCKVSRKGHLHGAKTSQNKAYRPIPPTKRIIQPKYLDILKRYKRMITNTPQYDDGLEYWGDNTFFRHQLSRRHRRNHRRHKKHHHRRRYQYPLWYSSQYYFPSESMQQVEPIDHIKPIKQDPYNDEQLDNFIQYPRFPKRYDFTELPRFPHPRLFFQIYPRFPALKPYSEFPAIQPIKELDEVQEPATKRSQKLYEMNNFLQSPESISPEPKIEQPEKIPEIRAIPEIPSIRGIPSIPFLRSIPPLHDIKPIPPAEALKHGDVSIVNTAGSLVRDEPPSKAR